MPADEPNINFYKYRTIQLTIPVLMLAILTVSVDPLSSMMLYLIVLISLTSVLSMKEEHFLHICLIFLALVSLKETARLAILASSGHPINYNPKINFENLMTIIEIPVHAYYWSILYRLFRMKALAVRPAIPD